jgi:indole-3-glycerol phosphate synthase
MGFLSDLLTRVRSDLAERPLDEAGLRILAAAAPAPRNLGWVLRGYAAEAGVALIAEVKRASPSAGAIAPEADPVLQATAYDVAGAAAISVLTEGRHFGGSLEDLRAVRAAVEHPVLRKDFLVDPSQIAEARAAGADSVLLIAAALPGGELGRMLSAARELGMEPLVETHSDDDLERAVASGAEVVGVNARDLETLTVDPEAARARLRRIPADRVGVLESGVATRDDVRSAVDAGASAVLVGEALMRAADPVRKVRELIGQEPEG